MQVDTLIYAYLAVCCSMIIFNTVCIFIFSHREKKMTKVSKRFQKQVEAQIERIFKEKNAAPRHIRYLKKRLKRTGNLLAFDMVLEQLQRENPVHSAAYLEAIHPVFVYLAEKYQHKDEIHVTFFLYILRKYRLLHHHVRDYTDELALKLIKAPSIYCRQNALEAIYASGNVESVILALRTIDESGVYHNAKLITDGLLKFIGNRKRLAARLWESLPLFSVDMQVALLNYFRFSSDKHRQPFLELLADEKQHDEIRFSCIRYLGKYPYRPAFPLLLKLADEKNVSRWEYAAIASSALASYSHPDTIEALKNNLQSPNWYVRFNASSSLEALGVSDHDMAEIFSGSDRYAREMLRYRLEQRDARKENEG